MAAWPLQVQAADQEWTGATGGAWLTLTNWASTSDFAGKGTATLAGEGTAADIAAAAAANAATNIGINLSTLGGLLEVGAIDWNKTNTAAATIGNSSTVTSGILRLNGASVNGIDKTLVRVDGEANLALSNVNTGTAAVTMGVRLGIPDGQFFVGQNSAATPALRTLTINSIISEAVAGHGFTKSGTGVMTLNAANLTTGPITINDGALRLQNASAAGTSALLVTNGDGSAINNNDVLISGGITVNNAITLENTGSSNARTRLQSSNVLNANANTLAGDITFRGPGPNQTLLADSAPFVISGKLLQDATPSTSILIRGGNVGTLNGNIALGSGNLVKTDGGTWTINSTGNNMGEVLVADGLLILNNNDCLEPDSLVTMGQGSATTGRLQINAGFTQQVTGVNAATNSTSPAGHTINGPGSLDVGVTQRIFSIAENAASQTELTINAPVSGTGGFEKAGTGTLVMNGNVAGPVVISSGKMSGTGTLSGGVLVRAGASLAAGTGKTGAARTVNGAVFEGDAGISALVGHSGSDLITNTGTLTTGGVVNITLTPNGSVSNGYLPLISYTGASPGVAAFALLGSPGSRATAILTGSGSTIGVTLSGADKVIWTGATDDNWDIATTNNWKRQSTSGATNFIDTDAVVFDNAGATTRADVALNTPVNPARLEFINTSAAPAYNITGTGGLAGNMVMDKTGTGTVTLGTTNTYTGATNILAGTLTANYNAGTAVIPLPAASAVSVAAGAMLRAIANDGTGTGNIVALAPALSGAGTVEINPHAVAGSALALNTVITGDNSAFTGTLSLTAPASGTFRINNATQANLGSASIKVAPGAQLFLTGRTISNPITIAGSGFADANGRLGALRIDNSTYSGNVVIDPAGGRINSHNSTSRVTGNISGGPLEVNFSNYNNSNTTILSGTNSYTTTAVGGDNIQTAGVPSLRVNIGDGGTSGTLGTGAATIIGGGANGIIGFDRSDGYTLAPANTITGSGTNLRRTFLDLECTGTGFSDGGVSITLGDATTGGNVRIGQARAGAIAHISGALTSETVRLSTGQAGGTLNILPGAVITSRTLFAGEASGLSGTILQTGGSANVNGQVRIGHFPNNTSTYTLNAGTLTLTGNSPLNTPSTTGAGAANATGDNNLNALAANEILGGGIYLGIDGQGVFNQNGGTVTTHWIVMDNRGNTGAGTNMTTGVDQYNLTGGILNLRSAWGILQRNPSAEFKLSGGTIRVDNTGTGGPAGNTGANLNVPLDAVLATSGTATLDTNGAGNGFTLGKDVTGTGTITIQGGGKITLSTATAQTVAANFGGASAFEKIGVGTTTTSGAHTYSGGTTVTEGTLIANGSLAGSTTVKAGATLGGTGTAGTIIVESGGMVAEGASPAALRGTSADLRAGSNYAVKITGAGTSDELNLTGALTANGTIQITLSGYVPVSGDAFDIVDATSITGTPTFDLTASVLSAGLSWDTSQFATSGTIRVSGTGTDPFTDWATANNVTGGKNGDDDGDRATNLLEFATNSNAKTDFTGARAIGKIYNNFLTLTIATRASAVFSPSGTAQTATRDQVVYTVQGSNTLTGWTGVIISKLNAADSAALQATLALPALQAGWEWHSFRTDDTTATDPSDFIRLSVNAQP